MHSAEVSDLNQLVRRGIPVAQLRYFQKTTGLPWSTIGRWVGIPPRTLARRLGEPKLRPDESDRVLRAGYQPRLTGENIAYGPESAEEVVAGWLASPGHCANIMDSRFQDIGVGLATGRKRGQIYWVQTFGAPR